MSASSKDFQSMSKEENIASASDAGVPTAINQESATYTQGPAHSKGLGVFLAQLASGNVSGNDLSKNVLGFLMSEKKVKEKRTDDFSALFDKALDVKDDGKDDKKDHSEMEMDMAPAGDEKGKKTKKGNCCGCGGCDE